MMRRTLFLCTAVLAGAAAIAIYSAAVEANTSPEPPAPSASSSLLFAAHPNAGSLNQATSVVGDSTYSFATYVDGSGRRCVVETLPGGGRGTGCGDAKVFFANSPLHVEWGSAQSSASPAKWAAVWIEGVIDTEKASSVEIVDTSCSKHDVAVNNDGAFIDALGEPDAYSGSWPYLVRALDSTGAVVATTPVTLGPPDSKAAVDAGASVPSPPTGGCGAS
jgi:hypothetical protein